MRRELLFPSCSYGRVRKSPEGSAVASCTLEPPGPHVRPNKISWSPLERSGPHHTTAHRHHPDPEHPRYIAAAASPSSLPTKALCGDGEKPRLPLPGPSFRRHPPRPPPQVRPNPSAPTPRGLSSRLDADLPELDPPPGFSDWIPPFEF
jgi:hypothetical protein